jgi:hypothetical protein
MMDWQAMLKRMDRLDLEVALLAVVDAEPRFLALGWEQIETAYGNALEEVRIARRNDERRTA